MNMILYIDLTIYIRVFSWNKNALFTFKLFFISKVPNCDVLFILPSDIAKRSVCGLN